MMRCKRFWLEKLGVVSLPYVASNTERGRRQAMIGAWSTVGLVAIVSAFWGVGLLAGEVQLTGLNLLIFNACGLGIVAWLGLHASSDRAHVLLSELARKGEKSEQADPAEPAQVRLGRVGWALTNLWIPVTCQFGLATWLVYASGGPTNSPFVSVPFTIMVIGQSVYHFPEIELCPQPGPPEVLRFIWKVIRFYAYPQLVFASMLVALAVLQVCHPLQTRTAPIAETLFASHLSLTIGMCVAFIARRVDRAAAQTG